jgi:hypothetical protein
VRFTFLIFISFFPLTEFVFAGSYDDSVIENTIWYRPVVETSSQGLLGSVDKSSFYGIDIRGAGDAAWAQAATPQTGGLKPIAPGFLTALKNSQSELSIFKGDLSFINLETVVAEYCLKKRMSVDYYFLTHPENINELFNAGFNLFGLANNHSQDCQLAQSSISLKSPKVHGPLATQASMERMEEGLRSQGQSILWSGVGSVNPHHAKLQTFKIKGKIVRVAMASISIISWEIPNSSYTGKIELKDDQIVQELLLSFDGLGADINVLSIHTQDTSGNNRAEGFAVKKLKQLADEFVINHRGTIVFGHGPHTFAGVKVIKKRDGKFGAIFTSLGNFIHPGLSPGNDNYLGRALINPHTFSVEEVQVFPLINKRTYVDFYERESHLLGKLNTNFKLQSIINEAGVLTLGAKFNP